MKAPKLLASVYEEYNQIDFDLGRIGENDSRPFSMILAKWVGNTEQNHILDELVARYVNWWQNSKSAQSSVFLETTQLFLCLVTVDGDVYLPVSALTKSLQSWGATVTSSTMATTSMTVTTLMELIKKAATDCGQGEGNAR